MNPTIRNVILSGAQKTREQLVKSAGGVLYLDARKADGSGLPANSPLTSPWADLTKPTNNVAMTNFVGDAGNMIDGNSDDKADGWSVNNANAVSCVNNIQTFIVTGQNGALAIVPTIVNTHKYYTCAYTKTDSSDVQLRTVTNVASITVDHSGSNTFEFLSLLTTATGDGININQIRDRRASDWTNIEVKLFHMFDLTALFGAGSEPNQEFMDKYIKTYIDSYGYLNGENVNFINAVPINFAGTTSSGYNENASKPAFTLDGTDDVFHMLDSTELDITAVPIAVFAVIKAPATLQEGYIFSKALDAIGNVQYGLLLNADGSLSAVLEGSAVLSTSAGIVVANTHYSVGLLADGTNVIIYVDRASAASTAFSSALTTRGNVRVGALASGAGVSNTFFKGSIATLTVYSGTKCTASKVLEAEKLISKAYI